MSFTTNNKNKFPFPCCPPPQVRNVPLERKYEKIINYLRWRTRSYFEWLWISSRWRKRVNLRLFLEWSSSCMQQGCLFHGKTTMLCKTSRARADIRKEEAKTGLLRAAFINMVIVNSNVLIICT